MRLSPREREVITAAVARHFGADIRPRLFGSRADDNARGGDIDLYLDVQSTDAREVLRCKLALLAELHAQLGDQRIDVVTHRKGGPWLAIHDVAVANGVVL